LSACAFAGEQAEVAPACRILAHRGRMDGVLGHVSLRTGEDENDGLAWSAPADDLEDG